jgi:hypothetical protein
VDDSEGEDDAEKSLKKSIIWFACSWLVMAFSVWAAAKLAAVIPAGVVCKLEDNACEL